MAPGGVPHPWPALGALGALEEWSGQFPDRKPKHYVFAYRPPTKAFNLKLSFTKSRVNRDEVIDALEAIIRDLKKGH